MLKGDKCLTTACIGNHWELSHLLLPITCANDLHSLLSSVLWGQHRCGSSSPLIHICLNSNSLGQTSTCLPLKQTSHKDIWMNVNVLTYMTTKNLNSALFQQNGLHESAREHVCLAEIKVSKLGITHSDNAIWSWSSPNYGWTWKYHIGTKYRREKVGCIQLCILDSLIVHYHCGQWRCRTADTNKLK